MPAHSFSLVAADLGRSFGAHTALDRVSLTIGPASRLGVLGPNGVGKSTLLRLLAGLEPPDRGRVVRTPPTLRVGFLPQEPDRRPGETVIDALARRAGVADPERALEEAARGLAGGTSGAEAAYSEALDRFLASGASDFAARAATVGAGLGIGADLLARPTVTLSGGEAARVSLAAILLSRFDVLLLDEPTNDLDFAGLDRLERFVDGIAGGVVIVSHDREFLERTVTGVLEIDEHAHTVAEYAGGFDAYLEARAIARRHAEEDYASYDAERTRLRSRAQRQRQWATQGATKAKRDSGERDKFIRQFRVNSSEQVASKAHATERALERLEPVEKPWEGWELRLDIATAPRSGNLVARLDDARVERDGFVLGPITLEVNWADRIAITGPNGAGKTTLLDVLLGRVQLTRGEQRLGPGVVVGGMDQFRRVFSGDARLLDRYLVETGATREIARSHLAKFGLTAEHVARPAGSLSPGERTRAVLALVAARGVNCLVLDEPTNHLDLAAIEQLEQALRTYGGTLLLVTHDRRLLDAVDLTRTVEMAAGRIACDA